MAGKDLLLKLPNVMIIPFTKWLDSQKIVYVLEQNFLEIDSSSPETIFAAGREYERLLADQKYKEAMQKEQEKSCTVCGGTGNVPVRGPIYGGPIYESCSNCKGTGLI